MQLTRPYKGKRFNSTGPWFVVSFIVVPALISAWLFALTLYRMKMPPITRCWKWVVWTMLGYTAPWLWPSGSERRTDIARSR